MKLSKTAFNVFGVLHTKPAPPKNSWWAEPAIQGDRVAFQQRLGTEEIRMLGSSSFTHDKFPAPHKRK